LNGENKVQLCVVLIHSFCFVLIWSIDPVISSAPENVTANIHDDLALSCEARGYPIPSLIWEFESAATGKKTKLPGKYSKVLNNWGFEAGSVFIRYFRKGTIK
jgi:hypothetical protein